MIWRTLFFSFVAVAPVCATPAIDAVARGRAARAEGVPQAAVYDLKRAASDPTSKDAGAALVELVRCLLEAGRSSEAVDWTRRTSQRNEPEVIFWRAQALASNGDYAAALKDYRRAGQTDADLRDESNFGSARMLEALGRTAEAQAIYAKIPAKSGRYVAAQLASAAAFINLKQFSAAREILEALKPAREENRDRRRYLLGRLAFDENRNDEAATRFEGFEPGDLRMAAGVVIGRVEANVRAGKFEPAEADLESFIRENPRNPLISELLAKLDEVRSRERNPSNAALKQWQAETTNAPLASGAAFFLARNEERQGRIDRATHNYAKFLRQFPDQPLSAEATIRLVRLLLAAGQTDAAKEALKEAIPTDSVRDRARLQFLRGATEYLAGDFAGSSRSFVRAANADAGLSQGALTNAALAAIESGSEPMAAEILNALRKESAAEARRIELAQAFENARSGNPDVAEQLAWLASQGGNVGNRARLGLSEWRWREGDRRGAREEFRRVANSPAAGAGNQRDYFAVYLADDGSEKSAPAVTAAAEEFLARHPDSPREAEVRMKWGEVLMRGGDFRSARVQFDEAARKASDAGLRQGAMLLSARAAAGSMAPEELEAAILTLEDVASEKNGDLAAAARWEQATLQSALGRPEESVKILDSLIATVKDPRLRFAARLKKAEALLAMGKADPARVKGAIAEWRAIAASADALPAERNEALTQAAAASERAGDFDAAIAAYYEALNTPRDRQPEYFWYYKAGFGAANLLISRQRLKEAAAIYEKMAAVPGPRAKEAAERVKRLRLENFIWSN